MAKAKEVSSVKAETKKQPEQFKITPDVLKAGYYAVIDDRTFAVTRGEKKTTFTPGQGQTKTFVPGSVFENDKPTGKDYFEDLTDNQMHILLCARVISLTPKQNERYQKYLNGLYKK